MAKGSRGGKRVGGMTAQFHNPGTLITNFDDDDQTAPQSQVDDTQVASDFGTDYTTFMAMSDDDKADVISNAISQDVPEHLAQNDFQRFLYHSGLNDKPDVVDDATLDTMTGTELFRTVDYVNNGANNYGATAPQIARQVMAGTHTRVSDTGGSAYGRGIYFADSYRESVSYGRTRNNVKSTAVMRAKLNNNAKIITDTNASNGASNEIRRGTKLGKILKKCDYASQASIYAMAKGYNVIDANNGTGYFVILNRNAMTMSSAIKPKSTQW